MIGINIKKILKKNLLVLTFVLVSGIVHGDEITDSIDEALRQYNKGEYTEAIGNLNYAAQLIQQKKEEVLVSFLPKPLKGWTTKEVSSQSVGAAVFGWGVSVGRGYSKDSSYVTVQIIADSPIIQGLMIMLANPILVTSDGGKLEKISGQKAIVKYDPIYMQGEIKIVVKNRFLVLIEGKKVDEDELKEYAKNVDYEKLQALQ